MYADWSFANRALSARRSRLDKCTRPRRPARAVSRRDPLPPRRADARPRAAARPRPCLEPAYPSNVTEPISVKRRMKLNDMSATLGERIRFIGNSLEKVCDATEAERNTLVAFDSRVEGRRALPAYEL